MLRKASRQQWDSQERFHLKCKLSSCYYGIGFNLNRGTHTNSKGLKGEKVKVCASSRVSTATRSPMVRIPLDIQDFLSNYEGEDDNAECNDNFQFYSNELPCQPDELLIDDLHVW